MTLRPNDALHMTPLPVITCPRSNDILGLVAGEIGRYAAGR